MNGSLPTEPTSGGRRSLWSPSLCPNPDCLSRPQAAERARRGVCLVNFTREKVQTYPRKSTFCGSGGGQNAGQKSEIPTGRNFAKKFGTFCPQITLVAQNSLDNRL
jgi:hypothetical protein